MKQPPATFWKEAGDTDMTATVVLRIGPIKARFEGAVQLGNLNQLHSHTISGEGKGGADVSLAEDGPEATTLSYRVNADVGGKIAQLGGRLINSTRRLATQFFSSFGEHVRLAALPSQA